MNLKIAGLRIDRGDKKYKEYIAIVEDILDNESVNKMNLYSHHLYTTCLEHSLNVSYYSYLICRRLRLDYKSAARAGLLHDFFLYEWKETELTGREHAVKHPKIAFLNANSLFKMNKREKDIIIKHMWPITLRPPRYMESLVVNLMDKYCATIEVTRGMFMFIKSFLRRQRI